MRGCYYGHAISCGQITEESLVSNVSAFRTHGQQEDDASGWSAPGCPDHHGVASAASWDTVPKELLLPGPEEFRSCSEEALQSLHLNAGFVIDIVSLPEQGAWSLQITEPDLGSDPGNPKQARQAVPGRIIETNIGFRIVDHQLQCGFQTVVSDVAGGNALAEVYRLAVVKRLANNPDFGLQQTARHQSQTKNTYFFQIHLGSFLSSAIKLAIPARNILPPGEK